MVASREKQVHFLHTGQMLGYPLCCILSFCNTPLAADRDWPNPWEGTGYVPCKRCAALPMMTVMGRINSRRRPDLPQFPSENV